MLRTHMRALASGLTDVGLQRDHNEDSYAVLSEYDLYIVADGMGGHRAGDVASRLATDAIAEFFRSTAQEDATWPFHFDTSLSEDENRLVTGIRVANRRIFDRSIRSRDCAGMGTTVVGALYSKKKHRIFVGHVGDSRAYRVRKNHIQQLTRDHSLINDYLQAMPELTDEQRAELPKNVITRALGMQDSVAVDLVNDEPQLGDVYLLCSDGLSGMLTDEQILEIVQAGHARRTRSVGGSSRRRTSTAGRTTSPPSSSASTTAQTISRSAPPRFRLVSMRNPVGVPQTPPAGSMGNPVGVPQTPPAGSMGNPVGVPQTPPAGSMGNPVGVPQTPPAGSMGNPVGVPHTPPVVSMGNPVGVPQTPPARASHSLGNDAGAHRRGPAVAAEARGEGRRLGLP